MMMIKLRTMKLYGHIVCMKEMRNEYKILKNLNGRLHLRIMGVDERILLKWFLNK
jgi:hypothetical protein